MNTVKALNEQIQTLQQRIEELEQMILEREQVEMEQEQSLSLLNTIFESINNGILVLYADGSNLLFNQRFIQLWRIPDFIKNSHDRDQIISFMSSQLKDHDVLLDSFKSLYNQALKEYSFGIDFKDGRIFETSIYPFWGRSQYIGKIWVFQDITERELAEREKIDLQEQIIQMQKMALLELSTPLIPITNQIVVMPLIGRMDEARAKQMMKALLHGLEARRVKVAIIDITGVSVVDSVVAGLLVQAAQAVQLLGTEIIITGIRPEVAETLVGFGMNLGGAVQTHATLQNGIAYAMKRQ